MAAKNVTGDSPLTFISEDTSTSSAGSLRQIPLPLIKYDDTSATPVTIDNSAVTGNDLTLAAAVIVALIKQGFLRTIN